MLTHLNSTAIEWVDGSRSKNCDWPNFSNNGIVLQTTTDIIILHHIQLHAETNGTLYFITRPKVGSCLPRLFQHPFINFNIISESKPAWKLQYGKLNYNQFWGKQ
jgi:hypothetical protein